MPDRCPGRPGREKRRRLASQRVRTKTCPLFVKWRISDPVWTLLLLGFTGSAVVSMCERRAVRHRERCGPKPVRFLIRTWFGTIASHVPPAEGTPVASSFAAAHRLRQRSGVVPDRGNPTGDLRPRRRLRPLRGRRPCSRSVCDDHVVRIGIRESNRDRPSFRLHRSKHPPLSGAI